MNPSELHYTSSHEWVREDSADTFTFGITHFAQDALGDIVFVALPRVGATLSAGESCGEIESTKSVSEIYAPIAGEVVAVNSELETRPERINAAPYSDGWLVQIRATELSQVDALLSAADYESLITSA